MATKTQAYILFFFLLTISCSIVNPSHAHCTSREGIAVFWGQRSESEEHTLQAACATANYKIVLLQYITVYEDGSNPTLNLANHCGWKENPCTNLESQIKYCQSKNIKVILTIGRIASSTTQTGINPAQAARRLAAFLWNNYLGGRSGPLGRVALDGINMLDVRGGSTLRWDEIVRAVNEYSTSQKKIYITATPECQGRYLVNVINTGLIDYAFVLFYFDPGCSYDSSRKDATKLLRSWKEWISMRSLSDKKVFMGLPASPTVTNGNGYIEPSVIRREILTVIKQAPNYGGVILFDRAEDLKFKYNNAIIKYVSTGCRSLCVGTFPFRKASYATVEARPHHHQHVML